MRRRRAPRPRTVFGLLAIAGVLAACSAISPGLPPDAGRSWHWAEVLRLEGQLPPPGALKHDCRLAAGAAEDPTAHYVEVGYHPHGWRMVRLHIARARAEDTLSVGETVYVNVADCMRPLARPQPASGAPVSATMSPTGLP